MKKRIISTVIAVSLVMGTGIQAFATPLTESEKQKIEENREKYSEVNSKITDLEEKIDALTVQIEPLFAAVQKNNDEIKKAKNEIKNTEKQIEKAKGEIKEKEELLGERMRSVYKSGGQGGSYLSIVLSSNSLGDLISKVEAVGKIVGIDKKIINDLDARKKELDYKVSKLSDKNTELDNLNKENQAKISELDIKKKEQEVVIVQLKDERAKIVVDLTESERSLLSYFVDVINNSSSSADELNSAITGLRTVRGQLKSSVIDGEAVNAIEKAKELITQKATPSRGDLSQATGNAASILAYAYQFIGRPYVYGATGPSSFDCSGFTSYVMNRYGVGLGRTTYDQIGQGSSVSYGNLQPGDLVFTNGVGHVGIYVGNGNMIHAPRPGESVKVGPIYGFSSARRVL